MHILTRTRIRIPKILLDPDPHKTYAGPKHWSKAHRILHTYNGVTHIPTFSTVDAQRRIVWLYLSGFLVTDYGVGTGTYLSF